MSRLYTEDLLSEETHMEFDDDYGGHTHIYGDQIDSSFIFDDHVPMTDTNLSSRRISLVSLDASMNYADEIFDGKSRSVTICSKNTSMNLLMLEDFDVLAYIGKGAFSKVYLVY